MWNKLFNITGRGILTTADIFMTIAVSVERYKAICKPLTPRHPVYLYLIFVGIISVTLEVPRFFEFELNPNKTDYWTTFLYEETIYIRVSSVWNDILVIFFNVYHLHYNNLFYVLNWNVLIKANPYRGFLSVSYSFGMIVCYRCVPWVAGWTSM